MNGDTSAPCRLLIHDMCPWGPCDCDCHSHADRVADAAEWDRSLSESV